MSRARLMAPLGAAIALSLAIPACTLAGSANAAGEPSQAADAKAGAAIGTEIALDSGRIRGIADDGVLRFRGVPYARPPVGDLRWAPPKPERNWQGVRSAAKPGPACPQPGNEPGKAIGAEDCLTVDITVPAKAAARPRPVMVWLHGGGFTSGTGAEYDTRRLAEQGDVIVVNAEFRLGTLGYLALPGMPGGGTFGLQDQQAALRWVRRNAAAFGGDAHNVTLFGESGGGVATCGHLTSPGSRGLFAKAILQSGSCGTELPPEAAGPGTPRMPFWRPMRESHAASRTAAERLGCTDPASVVSCLRDKPVADLVGLTDRFIAAGYGGGVLPLHPQRALRAGAGARVPVLSGNTSDEALMFAAVRTLLGQPVTDENLSALLRAGFGEDADAIARRYPRERYASATEAWAAPNTDAVFACPHTADRDALARRAPVYGYVFGDRTAPSFVPLPPGFPAGAGHASELLYLFDVQGKPADLEGNPIPLTGKQRAVAADLVKAWASFAHTGIPETGGRAWPRWRPGQDQAHLITEAPGSRDTTRTPRCDHRE